MSLPKRLRLRANSKIHFHAEREAYRVESASDGVNVRTFAGMTQMRHWLAVNGYRHVEGEVYLDHSEYERGDAADAA